MISLNRINDKITGSINGEQFGIHYIKEKFDKLKKISDSLDEAKDVAEYTRLLDKFKEVAVEDASQVQEDSIPNLYISLEGKYYLKTNNTISSISMPQELVDRIKTSHDKGIDVQPLIKFWVRFLRNPKLRKLDKAEQEAFSSTVFKYINMSYTNQELVQKLVDEKGYTNKVAEELATVQQVQITKEGLLKTYKVSSEITKIWVWDALLGSSKQVDLIPETPSVDPITGLVTYTKSKTVTNEERIFEPAVQHQSGDAFMNTKTGVLGHIISVGAVHSISWDQIDTTDGRGCRKGLHCGGITYIKGYQNEGTSTHNCLISAEDIGAIADDNTGALRCVRYMVLDEFNGTNGSLYHSSEYGKLTDATWAIMKQQIIDEFGKLQEEKEAEIANEVNELKNL